MKKRKECAIVFKIKSDRKAYQFVSVSPRGSTMIHLSFTQRCQCKPEWDISGVKNTQRNLLPKIRDIIWSQKQNPGVLTSTAQLFADWPSSLNMTFFPTLKYLRAFY